MTVASFNKSAARLSHDAANAGTAGTHARTNIAHVITLEIFIGASASREYTIPRMSKPRVSVASIVLWIGVAGLCAAQQPTFKRTELQRADLSVGPREAVQAAVDFQPGATSGKHTHPGEELGYILEGSLRFEMVGQAPVTLKAGDHFMVPMGKVHSATNVGPGNAKVLATYIVEKGKPIATPAP